MRLLVVESSVIVRSAFKSLLKGTDFKYDIASDYEEAFKFLQEQSYDFAVTERVLLDKKDGEIIALLNKHNIAPLVFTNEVDESFFESFESADIVEYILKRKYNNVTYVIGRLEQLYCNKDIKILLLNDSSIYNEYLKKNLLLHNFNVFSALNQDDGYEILNSNPDISLIIMKSYSKNIDVERFIENIRNFKTSSELKIVLITKDSGLYETSNLLNLGADDFLVEIFSRTEFYKRVYQNIHSLLKSSC